MKRKKLSNFISNSLILCLGLSFFACNKSDLTKNDNLPNPQHSTNEGGKQSHIALSELAQIFSEIKMDKEHLTEVFDAVNASSGNGYDEEYTLKNLLESPGKGVGDEQLIKNKAAGSNKTYVNPLKKALENKIRQKIKTKALAGGIGTNPSLSVEEYLKHLSSSNMQIYWPYSEKWDGKTYPIITFDPEDKSDSNIGYKLIEDEKGNQTIQEVLVTEELAQKYPIWVINRNDDCEYTSLEILRKNDPDWGNTGGNIYIGTKTAENDNTKGNLSLVIKDFTMNQHYDSWFRGASEFFIKIGSIDNFTASTEAEMKIYNPSVTDLMVIVKRRDLGKTIPLNAILVPTWTKQLESCAFIITEDDGGKPSSWKCEALVKIESKSYGFTINIPMYSEDDIVWRGQLSRGFFETNSEQKGGFGGVDITFAIK